MNSPGNNNHNNQPPFGMTTSTPLASRPSSEPVVKDKDHPFISGTTPPSGSKSFGT